MAYLHHQRKVEGLRMTLLKRSAQVSDKSMGNEVAVLHLSSGNYYTLNATGAAIWNYCSRVRSVEDILDFLASKHGIEKAAIEEEIRFFVNELTTARLLESSEPAG